MTSKAQTEGEARDSPAEMDLDLIAVGRRVREARKAAGFRSQQALAEAVGVARETINRIEQGRQTPDAATLAGIARKCGVTEGYLLGTEAVGQIDADALIESFLMSEEALRLSSPATPEELRAVAEELRGGVWARGKPTPRTVALLILSLRSMQ